MLNGNRKRFEAIVHAYSADLYRYAYWLCRDRFTAEDLVQETFARAWTSLSTLRDDSATKSWLYTILRNEHARLWERKQLAMDDEQDLDALADRRLGGIPEAYEMREALHALPPTYREPLLLQVLGGFTCEEIAEMMNLTTGAVMTRLSRARLALRRQVPLPESKAEDA